MCKVSDMNTLVDSFLNFLRVSYYTLQIPTNLEKYYSQ